MIIKNLYTHLCLLINSYIYAIYFLFMECVMEIIIQNVWEHLNPAWLNNMIIRVNQDPPADTEAQTGE